MNGKTVFIFVVSIAFFSLAARYRFLDSAHSMGMIRQGGGVSRHPALLDKDKDSYILIATAGVVPPYHGNARVVLEGDPGLKATFHNSGPAVDLGIHRHPEFRDNIYYDLRPKDRIALWVKIKRKQAPASQQSITASSGQPVQGALPPCTQCETETKGSVAETAGKKPHKRPSVNSEGNDSARHGRSPQASSATGNSWRGKSSRASADKGPAVAFYDAATNEPLLRIPIRFTGGGDNAH